MSREPESLGVYNDYDESYDDYSLCVTNSEAYNKQRQAEIEAANAAVREALEAFELQTRSQTLGAKLRFAVYYVSYRIRELLAIAFVRAYCRLTKKDSRLVSQKVWLRLGI